MSCPLVSLVLHCLRLTRTLFFFIDTFALSERSKKKKIYILRAILEPVCELDMRMASFSEFPKLDFA